MVQRALQVGDAQHLHHKRVLGHLAHQGHKLAAEAVELVCLGRQQHLEIGAPGEDALKVDPLALHINPDIAKERVDGVELLVPGRRLLLKHLEVGRHLHLREVVDVVLGLCEEVVPAADQLGLVLVVDKLQLVRLPRLLDLLEKLLERLLALCL